MLSRVALRVATRGLPKSVRPISTAILGFVAHPGATAAQRPVSRACAVAGLDQIRSAWGNAAAPSEPTKHLFVGNLAWATSTEDIRAVFEKFGPIEEIRIAEDNTGRPRGFAHVTFVSVEAASAAVKTLFDEPVFMLGRNLRCDFAAGVRKDLPPCQNVVVYDYDGDENDLQSLFAKHLRNITRFHVVRDRQTGQPKRVAFIDFNTTESAETAVTELQGTELRYGANLNLRYGTPRRTGPQNGAGGGGRGSGGQDLSYGGERARAAGGGGGGDYY